jgi:hypothetical protein
MRNVLDSMIRNGDRQVCESMYDSYPSCAPQWRMGHAVRRAVESQGRAGSVALVQRQSEVIQIYDDDEDEGSGDGDEDDFQDAEGANHGWAQASHC